jgi:hypothetical protein
MKLLFCVLCIGMTLLMSCSSTRKASQEQANAPCMETTIGKETAVLIAKGDAIQSYTLSDYNIIVQEQPKAWRVVFALKDPSWIGGGPDYLIDKKTGNILNATYNK